eukprot:12944903-Alexandrium_andersonii.AAC.1
MSASLVGSEMCIRDRPSTALAHDSGTKAHSWGRGTRRYGLKADARAMWAVSYTHLTLPTICSV